MTKWISKLEKITNGYNKFNIILYYEFFKLNSEMELDSVYINKTKFIYLKHNS